MPEIATQTDQMHRCDAEAQIDENSCSSKFFRKICDFTPQRVLRPSRKWHERGAATPGGSWAQTEPGKDIGIQAAPISKRWAKRSANYAEAEDRRKNRKGEDKEFRQPRESATQDQQIHKEISGREGFTLNKDKTIRRIFRGTFQTSKNDSEVYVPMATQGSSRPVAIYVPTPKRELPKTADELFKLPGPPPPKKHKTDISEQELEEMFENFELTGTSFLLDIKEIVDMVKNLEAEAPPKSPALSTGSDELNKDFSNYESEF